MRLRRIFFALTLTGALAGAPAVAMADTYPAPEVPAVTTSLPGTTAALGDTFTMMVSAPDGSEVVLTVTHDEAPDEAIQIAGVASHTKIAQGGGSTFSVTLHHEGTFTLVAAVDGEVVATHVISVVDENAASTAGDADADQDASDQGTGASGGSDTGTQSSVLDKLAVTGTEAAFFAVGAVLLLAAGAAGLVSARRRSRASS